MSPDIDIDVKDVKEQTKKTPGSGRTVPNWPPISGEYTVGNPASSVAIVTLGSELNTAPFLEKVALIGSMKTENIGIEKVVANIVSNTSIRYLVVCGAEVHGHLAGEAIMALRKNGMNEDSRIIGANGAIPYITNFSHEDIDHWRNQVEIVDLMGTEDAGTILGAIEKLAPKAPLSSDPVVVNFGGKVEVVTDTVRSLSPELVSLEARIRSIEGDVKDMGKMAKLMSGLVSGIYQGFVVGFLITLLLFAAKGVIA